MKYSVNSAQENRYDVVVIGAGHAGCEAALASARLGCKTAVFSLDEEGIALMPCNPNIGGTSKGHLVREVDALGGEMGICIDHTFIQSKMLNKAKGPAVHSLRAQADKKAYHERMLDTLKNQENLDIYIDEVTELLTKPVDLEGDTDEIHVGEVTDSSKVDIEQPIEEIEQGKKQSLMSRERSGVEKIYGVRTKFGQDIYCDSVIICTGTYLRSRCIRGDEDYPTGPNGLHRAEGLTDSLRKLALPLRRYKTGTPARLDRNTIDYSKMQEEKGDERVVPFSFTTDPASVQIDQISCWLTYTNEKTHTAIRNNLERSPLFSGVIEGTGPRYCPSIEDKMVKFPDKNRHQVFIEPEGVDTDEMYVGGMSSSLPRDVQEEMYHSVPGLEHARILKYAYAIEYDCVDARQLKATLECKDIHGLFCAGQFNGSSGYEEAAAQGLIAGINAARKAQQKEPVVIDRSQGYIGVLIDDLVTKESHEPYRMMTSRSEYRLLLRQDNADIRLTKIGHDIGLISEERYRKLLKKEVEIEQELARLEKTIVGATPKVQEILERKKSTPIRSGVSIADLIRRPEIGYEDLTEVDPMRPELSDAVKEQVEIHLKYHGYIERQQRQVEHFHKLESKSIPDWIDYSIIHNLRTEAIQKLSQIRPANIGQASRISGVSPSDISVLLIYLEHGKGVAENRRRV